MYRNRIVDSYLSLVLSLLIGLAGWMTSCSEVDMNAAHSGLSPIAESPVEVSLPIATCLPASVTRAALDGDEESRIYNLWLFVFDINGEEGRVYRFDAPGSTLQFATTSGYRRIYAVANVDETGELSTLTHDLTAVRDVYTLKQVMARMTVETPFRNAGHLLMSGIYDDGSDSGIEGFCTILPDVNVSVLDAPIRLNRLSARITFNISLDATDPDVTLKSFTPRSWRVVNLPASCSLFPTSDISTATSYFQMDDARPFEDIDTDPSTALDKASFTFYALENNQRGSGATRWSDREIMKADEWGMRSETFLNAPANATYVELCGCLEYEYDDPALQQTIRQLADVTYTIHLGYVGQDAYNNYECCRNTSYTYNVLVRGVDDLILKVERDNPEDIADLPDVEGPNEPGHGVNGDVIVYRQKQFFDAHYDRSVLSFNRQAVQDKMLLNGFFVRTPFCDGNFYIDDEELRSAMPGARPASEACDYSWVRFRRCDMKPDSTYRHSYSLYDPTNVVDVIGLIKDLRRGIDANGYAVYDKNGEAYYTLFIDENYYTVDPRTGQTAPTDFWKEFVNQPPRELGILSDVKATLEGKSTLCNCDTYIRQNAIRTIYSTTADSQLQTAWGIETTNETGQLSVSRFNPWEDVDPLCNNIITNQLQAHDLVGKEWAKYLSSDINRENQSNQLNLYSEISPFLYACIQRNRDDNGDGIIDLEELKWLPAADRNYRELWIGATSLPHEARLYPDDSRDYRRYLSSNGHEILAEEGESCDEYGVLSNQGYIGYSQPRTYDYRCVRLLGFEHYHSADDQPQSFAQVDKAQHLISVSWLAAVNLRSSEFYFQAAMQQAADDSYQNLPYPAFYYSDVDITTDTIPTGWRLPNDREMAILCDLIDDGWGDEGVELCYYPTVSNASAALTGKQGLLHYCVSRQMADGRHLRYMSIPSVTEGTIRYRFVRDAK